MKNLLAVVLLVVMMLMLNHQVFHWDPLKKEWKLRPLAQAVSVEENPMVELDFLSKKEVLDIRRKCVARYPALQEGPYEPSEDAFGQIQDGKAWWGIDGIYYYGNGQKSIEGPSEESRFLGNPYLLIGLCEPNAYVLAEHFPKMEPFYPKLLELTWHPDRKISVKYDVKRFFKGQIQYRCVDQETRKVDLIGINARDFGLNWLYVVTGESQNITWGAKANKPIRIIQFIHCGQSCGYPGGGNNLSPYQPEMDLFVPRLPAKAVIRLWKEEPADSSVTPDMTVTLEMI